MAQTYITKEDDQQIKDIAIEHSGKEVWEIMIAMEELDVPLKIKLGVMFMMGIITSEEMSLTEPIIRSTQN